MKDVRAQRAMAEAIRRGFLIATPIVCYNSVAHWRFLDQDEQGRYWFKHIRDDHLLMMPPERGIYAAIERAENVIPVNFALNRRRRK